MMSRMQTVSPIDGRVVVARDYASDDQLARAIAHAVVAQKDWRRLTLAERMTLIRAGVDNVLADEAELARDITLQMGRPLSQTPGEIAGFGERARHMIGLAEEALAPIQLPAKDGATRFITRDAVGVVLTIAPWNYPLLTAVNSIVPALLAGNAVLLKPSDQTPTSAERVVEAFVRAGVPAGAFQFVHATHEQVAQMMRSPEIGYVSFTGSVQGGVAIETQAAGRFIGTGLELGGLDAAYVRADADVEAAVESIVDGAYFNAGQSCCGIQRIFVARTVYDDFVERASALASRYVLGDPMSPDTTLGPVVRASSADRVRAAVAQAVAQGAVNTIDAARFKKAQPGTAYVAPALLTVPHTQWAIMREECFGPVACVMPINDDAAAMAAINDCDFGLTAAIYTRDMPTAITLGQQLDVGTVFMNRCDYLDPGLAWTGVKQSGNGVSLSILGFGPLTQPKSFHLRA
ncbi:aldehyde dehydrogenase family protein [Schauerella aestuarii]|uniref:aldehyde dehydrogenase family protein n=1 Tax=Schauerella aestuarii TaxID=2511204 RepID=UPI0013713140|nr:aldehyde dehydrogenase family protein [Achromobacter aestuarii]MYZ41947.1 aldehyde dehydrogenase family protein [Achromobacter aestuarii]